MKIENAIIQKTILTPANEGMGFILSLQGENWNSDYSGIIKDINGINAIIVTLGANSWEQLTEHPVRIKIDETQIVNIGNFIANEWLMLDKDMNDTNESEETPENSN